MLRIIAIRRCFSSAKSKGGSTSKTTSDKCKGGTSGNTGSTDSTRSDSNEGPQSEYPSQPAMYDIRKYGHNLPGNNVMTPFEALPCMPTGLFRCTYGEVLGPGADKCGAYPVPEYFSYHHMTFYDFHLLLRPYRMPCPNTHRKL